MRYINGVLVEDRPGCFNVEDVNEDESDSISDLIEAFPPPEEQPNFKRCQYWITPESFAKAAKRGRRKAAMKGDRK